MSPVQQRKARDPRSMALALGGLVLGLVLLIAVFVFGIPKVTESGSIRVRPPSNRLALGNAEVKAQRIAEEGPFFFQDPSGGTRDVWVQHLGSDPRTGWLAFDARRPGTGRECNLTWDRAARTFTDPCARTTVPADGGDLPRYAVEIDGDDQVSVALATAATTTTVVMTGSLNR